VCSLGRFCDAWRGLPRACTISFEWRVWILSRWGSSFSNLIEVETEPDSRCLLLTSAILSQLRVAISDSGSQLLTWLRRTIHLNVFI
jgi:hypothetical protein